MDRRVLLALSPPYIVRYIAQHPVRFDDAWAAKRGSIGDTAGVTPTPAVHEFLVLLEEKKDLFAQPEYIAHCAARWGGWWKRLSEEQKMGVAAKLRCNFYCPMIDTLHVWAMLFLTQWYDTCWLDSLDDAIGKTDITLKKGNRTVRVALRMGTQKAAADRRYKVAHRGGTPDCIEIPLPSDRPWEPGHKIWYRLSDLECLRTNTTTPYCKEKVLRTDEIHCEHCKSYAPAAVLISEEHSGREDTSYLPAEVVLKEDLRWEESICSVCLGKQVTRAGIVFQGGQWVWKQTGAIY